MSTVIKTLRYRYGQYTLEVIYYDTHTSVSMYDNNCLRFPLLWSLPITNSQAYGMIKLFENIGYFDMPEYVN